MDKDDILQETHFPCNPFCLEFFGTCYVDAYLTITGILENVHCEFGLTRNKMVVTVTDNGTNFIKAFKIFGAKESENSNSIIDITSLGRKF
ncbi:zinc knuckle protein [Vespula maculifrons]|uniref:Zinc knuckle protein n=1 Tax=Vespula maculifrons TaxID=7453 RepID=A0ABD2BCN4_VESMC